MKKTLLITLIISLLIGFGSCEKAEYSNDDDGTGDVTENVKGTDNEGDGTDDNGEDTDMEHAGGEDDDTPLGATVDVSTFRNTPIYNQVWVVGYIVGAATGANGRTRYDFTPPFDYDTALLLADDPDADTEDETISVCLTGGSKKMRALLNLADNPDNRGQRLAVFGFQAKYLKIPGIKHIDAYVFPAE